jgi:hypothetical protein
MENQIADDMRSHVSHFSAVGAKMGKPRFVLHLLPLPKVFFLIFLLMFDRSIADGQSHHSFSNNSGRGYLNSAFPTNLVNSRPGNFDN